MKLARTTVAAGLALVASGCIYLNGLYNAERAYADAERARLDGQDSLARAGYEQAAAGAERSYRRDPKGKWSDDALFLLGRARLRGGDWSGARSALEQARDQASDPDVRLGAILYLGATRVATGDGTEGVMLLDQALDGLGPGRMRGEGHLWRARHLLAQGLVDFGWADLERARLEDPSLRTSAALEWLTSGVLDGDALRAREGVDALLVDQKSAVRVDTVAALAAVESERWGARAGARLLGGADSAAWIGSARDRLILARAQLFLRAGDSAAARADGTRVVVSGGQRAIEGRLFLARLALGRLNRVEDLDQVRPLLVPAVEDPAVRALLEGTRQLELLAERGRQASPLGLFAAAEVARDVLDARRLAEALFLEYATLTPSQAWRGKALLAAAAVATDSAQAAFLLREAATLHEDPYVAVAFARPGDSERYETLERGLRDALASLLSDVTAAVRVRDMLVRPAADSVEEEPR